MKIKKSLTALSETKNFSGLVSNLEKAFLSYDKLVTSKGFLHLLPKAIDNFNFLCEDIKNTPPADLKQGYLEDISAVLKMAFPQMAIASFKEALIKNSLISKFMELLKTLIDQIDKNMVRQDYSNLVNAFLKLPRSEPYHLSGLEFLIKKNGILINKKTTLFLENILRPDSPLFEEYYAHIIKNSPDFRTGEYLFWSDIFKLILEKISEIPGIKKLVTRKLVTQKNSSNISENFELNTGLSILLLLFSENPEVYHNLGKNSLDTPEKNRPEIKKRIELKSIDFNLDDFSDTLTKKGLVYEKSLLKRLHLSFCTKPFVILSGISGMGKTRLIIEYARYMTQKNRTQGYSLVSIRPDFNRASHILGNLQDSEQSLSGRSNEYLVTSSLQTILKALADPDNPYFLILDEMNLGRAEHYFSDFLSSMESKENIVLHNLDRCAISKKITTPSNGYDNIIDSRDFICNQDCRQCFFLNGSVPEKYSSAYENCVPPQICLPSNLFIAGTVNFDDAGNSFSAKLIDRANTIDMIDMDMDGYLKMRFSKIDFAKGFEGFPEPNTEISEKEHALVDMGIALKKVYSILRPFGLHFGYRTLKEIMDYTINSLDAGLYDQNIADELVCQKIVPKFYGKTDAVLIPLLKLFCFSLNDPKIKSHNTISEQFNMIIDSLMQDSESRPNELIRLVTEFLNSQSTYNDPPLVTARSCAQMILNLCVSGNTNYA